MIKNRQTKQGKILRKKKNRKARLARETMQAYSNELKLLPKKRLQASRKAKEERSQQIMLRNAPTHRPTKKAFLIGGEKQ